MGRHKSILFLAVSAGFLAMSLVVSYYFQRKVKSKQGEKYTFMEFLNDGRTSPSAEDLLVGLLFGFTFALMDAIGTWVGMDNITSLVSGSPEMKAVVAGAYSDVMGITLGTLVTVVVRDELGIKHVRRPIWLNIVGILLGSTVGAGLAYVAFPPGR